MYLLILCRYIYVHDMDELSKCRGVQLFSSYEDQFKNFRKFCNRLKEFVSSRMAQGTVNCLIRWIVL